MSTLPDELRLESDRTILRDWRDEDPPALEPVCGEWDVCAFSSVPWSYSKAGAPEWIDRQHRKRAAGTVLALARHRGGLSSRRVGFRPTRPRADRVRDPRENVASQRVAERLGASPEGIRERSHQAEGRAWDMTIWSLTR